MEYNEEDHRSVNLLFVYTYGCIITGLPRDLLCFVLLQDDPADGATVVHNKHPTISEIEKMPPLA